MNGTTLAPTIWSQSCPPLGQSCLQIVSYPRQRPRLRHICACCYPAGSIVTAQSSDQSKTIRQQHHMPHCETLAVYDLTVGRACTTNLVMTNTKESGFGHHIATLDGIRGFAAAAVVLSHTKEFFGHVLPVEAGFLAVDLFFVMSGLVIEKSYGLALRDGSMTFAGFVRRRLVRLYPLYVLGALLGCLIYLRHLPEHSPMLGLIATVGSCASILPQAFFGLSGSLFDFNQPSWSLSIELYCGLIFALISPRLKAPALLGISAASLGILAYGAAQNGNLNLGWNVGTFAYGIARFCYSYPLGILIWRHRAHLPRLGIFAPFALAVGMSFPALPDNDVVRLIWVALALPIAVIAATQITMGSMSARWCKAMGRMSYPLYITHIPVLKITVSVLARSWGLGAWHDPRAGAVALLAVAASTAFVTYVIEPKLTRAFSGLVPGAAASSTRPSSQIIPQK